MSSPSPVVRIAVVIPCYRVIAHIAGVVSRIGPEVWRIYCVDDKCPDGSGTHIEQAIGDPRVRVLRNPVNLGVGGAVITGYQQAIDDGADIIVKIDGDGQMDPALLGRFVKPIEDGLADYTKGNRFFRLEGLKGMPRMRLFGNAGLSFLTKASSGYWTLFDPTNGYTAIHAAVARELPMDKLEKRYFFESDLLFRLNTLGTVVMDIPMDAVYGDEVSNLDIRRVFLPFLAGNIRNFGKRFFYNYVLRDFNAATVQTLLGVLLLFGGSLYGGMHWIQSMVHGVATPAGTVMAAALPVIAGLQLLLAAMTYDVTTVPRQPLHPRLSGLRPGALNPGPENPEAVNTHQSPETRN